MEEKENKTAKWIWDKNGMDWGIGAWVCSSCHCRNDNIHSQSSKDNPMIWSGTKYCPNCGKKIESAESIVSLLEFYDQEEIHRNCTVQILTNTKTGDISLGWWKNGESDE